MNWCRDFWTPRARPWHASPGKAPQDTASDKLAASSAVEEPKTATSAPPNVDCETSDVPASHADAVGIEPKPADPFLFFYHSSGVHLHAEFSPYSPHPIMFGGRLYPTVAHLYWLVAFSGHTNIVRELNRLADIDHQASLVRVIAIARAYSALVASDPSFSKNRLSVMYALQAMKFAQHSKLCERLVATGDRPIVYSQCSSQTTMDVVSQTSDLPSDQHNLHFAVDDLHLEDDSFWGTTASTDKAAEGSNHLGEILMKLRRQYQEEDDGNVLLEICSGIDTLTASIGLPTSQCL